MPGPCGPNAEELLQIINDLFPSSYLIQEFTDADRFQLEDETGFILLEQAVPKGIWVEMDPAGDSSIWVEQLGPNPNERGVGIPAASFEV